MNRLGKSAIVVALALFAGSCGGWLRRPPGEIEAALLQETPLNSTKEVVKRLALERGREIDTEARLTSERLVYPGPKVDGENFVRVHLGGYRPLYRVDVIAFYIFDEAGRLMAIRVRKDTDSL